MPNPTPPSEVSTASWPTDVARVAFAGDWHADDEYGSRVIAQLAGRVDVLLHTGDFGYHFTPTFLSQVTTAARKAGLVVMFVDGNHEDFDWLLAQPVDGDGVRRLTDRVWHLPRGFRWEWSGLRFLALGGAHSVDRPQRVSGASWWPQEWITRDEAWIAIRSGPVDVMVTHDAPDYVAIPGLRPDLFDSTEILSSEFHREQLGVVVDVVGPRYLWHGHYHVRYQATRPLTGQAGQTKVVGLAANDPVAPLTDNYQVVDLTALAQRED